MNYNKLGKNLIYCGPHGFSCSLFFGSQKIKCVHSWFENVETHYVHKARTGIHRALELLKFCKGDEILVPSYNCGSEVDAMIYSGAKVVPYRVDQDCNIDFSDLISRITPKIKAIYITHYFGFPQDVITVKYICKEYNLYLIEDCALSLFSSDNIGKLGTGGDISVYNIPKTLPVPDGGLLVINNKNLIIDEWKLSPSKCHVYLHNIIRLITSMVFRKYIPDVITKKLYYLRYILKNNINTSEALRELFPEIPKDYYYNSYNNNRDMSELSKFILKRIDYEYVIKQRRNNYILYNELLADFDAIKPIFKELPKSVCPLYYPIIINNRDYVCLELNKLHISAISWWAGYHNSAFNWDHFPDACFLKNNTLVLPVHQDLKNKDIIYIVNNLKNIIKKTCPHKFFVNNVNNLTNSRNNI